MSAITSIERVRRSSPGRDHTEPQAPSVMKRWKSASNSVVRACAPSTCESPSTLRRTRIPAANRSSAKAALLEEIQHRGGDLVRPLDAGQVAGACDLHQPRMADQLGELPHQIGGCRAVMLADEA